MVLVFDIVVERSGGDWVGEAAGETHEELGRGRTPEEACGCAQATLLRRTAEMVRGAPTIDAVVFRFRRGDGSDAF